MLAMLLLPLPLLRLLVWAGAVAVVLVLVCVIVGVRVAHAVWRLDIAVRSRWRDAFWTFGFQWLRQQMMARLSAVWRTGHWTLLCGTRPPSY